MFSSLQETVVESDIDSAETSSMAVVGDGELVVDIYNNERGRQRGRGARVEEAVARMREMEDERWRRASNLVDL